MISGDLIRIRNMVDDCVRLARQIHREAERLTPEERTQLSSHLTANASHLNYLVDLAGKGEAPAPSKS